MDGDALVGVGDADRRRWRRRRGATCHLAPPAPAPPAAPHGGRSGALSQARRCRPRVRRLPEKDALLHYYSQTLRDRAKPSPSFRCPLWKALFSLSSRTKHRETHRNERRARGRSIPGASTMVSPPEAGGFPAAWSSSFLYCGSASVHERSIPGASTRNRLNFSRFITLRGPLPRCCHSLRRCRGSSPGA